VSEYRVDICRYSYSYIPPGQEEVVRPGVTPESAASKRRRRRRRGEGEGGVVCSGGTGKPADSREKKKNCGSPADKCHVTRPGPARTAFDRHCVASARL
jgi:hypothetical protein